MAKITVLADNNTYVDGMCAEHGLSLWIETATGTVLFDMGKTDAFLKNARRLGIAVQTADAVVLSHGHYDHTGGMEAYLEAQSMTPVHLHPGAFITRYNGKSIVPVGEPIGIGWSPFVMKLVESRMVMSKDPHELIPGLWSSGEVKRCPGSPSHGFVTPDGKGGWTPDIVPDEQFLILVENGGLWLMAGCCHFGLSSMLSHAGAMFPGIPIKGIAGGLHFKKSTDQEVRQAMALVDETVLQWIVPLHCTGNRGMEVIKRIYGERCKCLGAGDAWEVSSQVVR